MAKLLMWPKFISTIICKRERGGRGEERVSWKTEGGEKEG